MQSLFIATVFFEFSSQAVIRTIRILRNYFLNGFTDTISKFDKRMLSIRIFIQSFF